MAPDFLPVHAADGDRDEQPARGQGLAELREQRGFVAGFDQPAGALEQGFVEWLGQAGSASALARDSGGAVVLKGCDGGFAGMHVSESPIDVLVMKANGIRRCDSGVGFWTRMTPRTN
jgi:hypothetical protein